MLTILGRSWWLMLLRGIAAVLFGLTAVLIPQLTLLFLVILFGVFVLLDGILAGITALRERRSHPRWWLPLLEGVLGLGFGIAILVWPQISLLVLIYLAAGWAILTGVMELITAVALRQEISNEWLLVIAGIASLAVGGILLLQPESGVLAAAWLIGIYALILGILQIILSIRLKSYFQDLEDSDSVQI